MHAVALWLLTALAACSAGGNATLSDLAAVSVTVNYAGMALSDDDRQRAAQLLSNAGKYAASARRATAAGMPVAWRNASVGKPLGRAAGLLSDAVSWLQKDAASNDTRHLDAAQSDRERAALEVLTATSSARRIYTRMGGRAADLESFQDVTQRTLSTLDSMMGHGSDDDSST